MSDSGASRGGGAVLTQGTLAARPANPTTGQLYFATDTGELFIGNLAGNAWQSIAATSASPTFSVTSATTGIRLANGAGVENTNALGITQVNNNGIFVGGANGVDIQTLGAGVRVAEGANAKQGVATLAAGTVTVANTSVTASSRIFLTPQETGALTGIIRVSARTAGTSFTITSTVNTDTAVVAWEIFEPG